MERGYINIKEDESGHFTVEAKLVNGTLWLSEWEIARLFNTFTTTIGNNFRAIFKSGLLNERKVSYEYVESDGKSRCILFNFEAILFVSYRINTLEARAFREWALKSVSEYTRNNNNSKRNIVINYNMGNRSSTILQLILLWINL